MASGGRSIDLANPVSDSPLNRGLVSWWLPLPNNSGGTRLHDIKGGKHGVLTSGPTWATNWQGGAAPSVRCDGNDDYIETSSSADFNGVSVSVSIWFRDMGGNSDNGGGTTDIRNNDYVIGLGGYNFSTGGWGLTFISSTQVQWSIWSGTASTAFALIGNAFTTGSGWNYACLTAFHSVGIPDVPSSIAYFSGVPSGSENTVTNRAITGSYIRMAKRPVDGELYCSNIQIGSVRVHNRILPASEVLADYSQGVRGNPDTLRRWSRKSYAFLAASGTTTNPSAVTAAAAVIAPSLALSATFNPVTMASAVAGPALALNASIAALQAASAIVNATLALSNEPSPVASAGGIAAPSTALASDQSPVGAAASVPAVTDGRLTDPDPVAASGGAPSVTTALASDQSPATASATVAAPAGALSASQSPVTAAGGVASVTTALGYAADAVAAVGSVPEPTVASGTFETPDAVGAASSAISPALALAAALDAVVSSASVASPTTAMLLSITSPPTMTMSVISVGTATSEPEAASAIMLVGVRTTAIALTGRRESRIELVGRRTTAIALTGVV